MAVEQQPITFVAGLCERHMVTEEQIPQELVSYSHWVCWRYVERGAGKKPEKQPINPRTLHRAGVHWPNTWTDFDTAYHTYLACHTRGIQGIGFVLTPDDPYVAIDLDGCVQAEKVNEHAAAMIVQLGSYTEVSPSGQGLRILVACPDFHENTRRPQYELYSHARYVTVTGHHVAGTPTEIVAVTPKQLTALLSSPALTPEPTILPAIAPKHYPASVLELWERIFKYDQYGAQHLRRFQGDTSLDRDDHSFTVVRLLNCLARWTNTDAGRMRTMMLLSPLANEKWFEPRGKTDWLDYQIADAIAYVRGRGRK